MASSVKKKQNKIQVKRKQKTDYEEQIIMWITSIFLLFMFVVYPIYVHNRYFDITLTKYLLFKIGVICYSILFILAVLMKYLNRLSYNSGHIRHHSKDGMKTDGGKNTAVLTVDILMLLFLVSGFIAWLMAADKNSAFTGETGRRCGLQFMILSFVMYACLAYGYKLKEFMMPVFAVISSATYVIAILQHFGFNPLKLLDGVNKSQRNMFIATFGNINTFASFVCIGTALFMGLFLFEDKKTIKVLYGVTIFLSGGALIAANSDCVYAGCGFAAVVLLFIAIGKKRLAGYLGAVLSLLTGYIAMALMIRSTGRGLEKISGMSRAAEHVGVLLVIAIVMIILLTLCKLARPNGKINVPVKVQMIVVSIIVAAAVITVIAVGVSQSWEIFTFNDKWGTNRGYVWSRLVRLYKDFPLHNKLFGYGNESVEALMVSNYYDEMMEITGVIYDNAHNEYLQYLVTMGIFGALSYIGAIVSAVFCGIKYGKRQPVLYACAAAVCAYCAQAAFNVNQSITTPYVFLFVGLIVGIARNMDKQT